MLIDHPEHLTADRLRAALGARQFRFFPEVGSTNDEARLWADAGAPSGSVVVAEQQHAGRGRFGRTWVAPPATALMFSMVVRSHTLTKLSFGRVTMLAAVAVAQTLEAFVPTRLTLKWPNDVHLDHRKVVGILPEATWRGDEIEFAILGIGINIRAAFEGTPLAGTAISLEPAAQTSVDRATLLATLADRLDAWFGRIDRRDLFDQWRSRLSTIGQQVVATSAEREINGQALDVDPEGALIIRDDAGRLHHVSAGEVTLRKTEPPPA